MHGKQRTLHKRKKMTMAECEEKIIKAEACVQKYGDKEALVLFCLMKETGIRLGDLVNLRTDHLRGRELLVVESKYGAAKLYYHYPDGSFPIISKETAKMLVPGEDGKFFHHGREHYIRLFRKVIPDKEFRYYYIRRYVMDKRRIDQEVCR